MRSKRMIFSVAAMLVAALLVLAACGGQENSQPQEESRQQVLFDVTQFIGVDEAGLVAIMGEPAKTHVNQSNNKEYTYKDITYTYNGEQDTFYTVLFRLGEKEDGTYKIDSLRLESCAPGTGNTEDFKFEPGEDIFALIGIETDVQISEEQSNSYFEKYENVMDGIDSVLFSSFDKQDTAWSIFAITIDYSE